MLALRHALCFAAIAAAALLSMLLLGAFTSGFGAFEDEPAHYVTALMIRDWLAGGDYAGPMAYAENYYVHYPKVAVGQWPPLFHGSLALWMLVSGTTTMAVAAFMTLLTATMGGLVYAVVAPRIGSACGLLAALLYLVSPIARECSASVMTETMVAIFALGAIVAFGSYVDSPDERSRTRCGIAFGVLSVATILTKGSGLALAFVPLFTIVGARRFDVLLRPSLWCVGLAIGALTAPWYALTIGFSQGTWAGGSSPSLEYALFAAETYGGWMPRLVGSIGGLFALVGIVYVIRRRKGVEVAVAAWVPALLTLHLVVPSSIEERHLAVLAPAWAILAAFGAREVVRIVMDADGRDAFVPRGVPASLALCVVALPLTAAHPRHKDWSGYGAAAIDMATDPSAPARWMIASDPVGEGLFVAGTAAFDAERPSRVVLRGSKVLGAAGWSGRDYVARFDSPFETEAWLRSQGVGLVLVDTSVRDTRHWYAHMDLLEKLGDRADWDEVGRWDLVRDGVVSEGALVGFRFGGWEQLPAPPLGIEDVRYDGSRANDGQAMAARD